MAVSCLGKSSVVLVRLEGTRHGFSIGSVAEKEALSKSTQVDDLLIR